MRAVEVFMLERGILPRQVAALVSAGELFPGANDVQSAICGSGRASRFSPAGSNSADLS